MERNRMSKVVAVIPSCREKCLRNFLDAWYPYPWNETVIVWDGEQKPDVGPDMTVYNHNDIFKTELAVDHRIFSRGDAAIRCYGFWQAVKTCNATHVITLDDDCYPENGMRDLFVNQHMENFEVVPSWVSSVPGVAVRGLPYTNDVTNRDVAVSMGLWTNHADIDGIHALMKAPGSEPGFQPPRGIRLMSNHQLFPFCGMNFAFPAYMLPLMYFPIMGKLSPYSRFDDIWAGLLIQTACRWMGKHIAVGEPFVEHRRASLPFANLQKEAPGLELNEYLWQRFTKDSHIARSIPTAEEAARELVGDLIAAARASAGEWSGYLTGWAESLEAWLTLCKPGPDPAGLAG